MKRVSVLHAVILFWVNRPFPCGSFPDLRIFRSGMKKQLAKDELAIADGGYRDSTCRKSGGNPAKTRLFSFIRARPDIIYTLHYFHSYIAMDIVQGIYTLRLSFGREQKRSGKIFF